jgi:hypothetical protein
MLCVYIFGGPFIYDISRLRVNINNTMHKNPVAINSVISTKDSATTKLAKIRVPIKSELYTYSTLNGNTWFGFLKLIWNGENYDTMTYNKNLDYEAAAEGR